ncbi:MAG: dephospho-CoA kinase [Chitinophagaceae bacterium]
MLRIGLTGGLGSGKSTVAHIFEVLGIPVYYADVASKRLMKDDEKIRTAVQNAFGKEVYQEGELDRKYLAEIVFKDEKKLELLNSIVHPATIKDAEEWMKQQVSPYAIKEAALIFESGSEKNLDYVIGVRAPLELRLDRVIKRDNLGKEEALERMKKQMDEETKMSLCDFVIISDEKNLVIPQVLALHKKFLKILKK